VAQSLENGAVVVFEDARIADRRRVSG